MTKKAKTPATQESLNIFRSYDVRGIYKKDLDGDVAFKIGQALGTYLGKGKTVVVGMDYRKGGPQLKAAFIKGALSTGLNVVDFGIIPTPIYYFSIINGKFDGGAMVTASHNPAMWNGFKLCRKNAELISSGQGMEEIRSIFAGGKFKEGKGSKKTYANAVEDYVDYIVKNTKLKRPLSVVIDPGNGAWCHMAKMIFEKLGCKVTEINGTPDSNFSGRGPDPIGSALDQLCKETKRQSADFGMALDADGDRASFVDDTGRYVGAAEVMVPLFLMYLYANKAKGSKVVYDVHCSQIIADVVRSLGGVPIESKTGRASIIKNMENEGAIIGGESSNHIYFSQNFNLDDGVYTGVRLAELLSGQKAGMSELTSGINTYPDMLMKSIDCSDETKFRVVDAVGRKLASLKFDKIVRIDGVKAFKDNGWVLIRASNTTPIIRIYSEAKTTSAAKGLSLIAEKAVEKEIGKLAE